MKLRRWLVWKTLQSSARVLGSVMFDLKVYGLEHIPKGGAAIIAANHESNLDPILLNTHLRRPLSYVAKSELFEVPFLSFLLWSVGAFPVHQGAGDVAAVRRCIRRLEQGHLLNIYPEGARTHDGQIGPMERGIALIDRRAHVPVIPAAIIGTYEAWPWDRSYPTSGPVRIQFGPAMELAHKSADEIVATIDGTLHRMVEELRERLRHENGYAHKPRHNGNGH